VTLVVSPTLEAVYTKLRALVVAVVPAGVEVIQGLPNRSSLPPSSPGFVAMTAVLQRRLRTNVDAYVDPVVTPGEVHAEQGTQLSVQLDCYGALSGDWANMLSNVLRSDWGCGQLAPTLAPLYVDQATMAPLVDSEKQYEQRWIVPAELQYNPVTSTPMEFADTLNVSLINVDERYTP
jgi:hypothetical protein